VQLILRNEPQNAGGVYGQEWQPFSCLSATNHFTGWSRFIPSFLSTGHL